MKLTNNQYGSAATIVAAVLGFAVILGVGLWLVLDSKTKENTSIGVEETQQQAEVDDDHETHEFESQQGVRIQIDSPHSGEEVRSPLTVEGEVPGNWSFEADFPIEIRDANGTVIAQGIAQLQGDWMTTALVPFSVQLDYEVDEQQEASLVLIKDNPSGLAENDDTVILPITLLP